MFQNLKRRATKQLTNSITKKTQTYNIKTRSSSKHSVNNISTSSTETSASTSHSLSTISEEMATPQEIFDSLRIPDVIKDLNPFDGDPKSLSDFIKNVEEILLFIRNTDGTPYGQILLRAIRNKIVGPANEALNSHLTPLVWENIKDTLKNLYTDKRDESTLIRELHNMKQTNKSTIEFYNEIIEIQSILANKISINETNASVKTSKISLYNDICLNVFLSGLKDPLGPIIRAMRPTNLSSALNYCQKEEAISFPKPHYNQNSPYINNYQNPFNPTRYPKAIVPFNRNYQREREPRRSFNQRYPQPNFNPYNNYGGTNRQIPQIKESPSAMTRQNSNMPRREFSQQNRFNRQNNFKIEELNNINNIAQPQPEPEDNNINDTQNFCNIASRNRSDT